MIRSTLQDRKGLTMAIGDKTHTGATEKVADKDTFCHYCGATIKKGQTCYTVSALYPKTECEDCEESACARKMERETENFIDSNYY